MYVLTTIQSAEVVKEMIEEMVEEGIQPIAPDGESIQAMLNAIEAKHRRVQETQQEILSCLGRAAMSEEQIYYAKVTCSYSSYSIVRSLWWNYWHHLFKISKSIILGLLWH